RPSVTPRDDGCQALIAERLTPLGFEAEAMPSGEVENLWLRRGRTKPVLVFAGHTDVVPPGPVDEWRDAPFEAVVRGDVLTGRGAADMKGSLAAMVGSAERFARTHPDHEGSIALL